MFPNIFRFYLTIRPYKARKEHRTGAAEYVTTHAEESRAVSKIVWIFHRTFDNKVRGSSLALALMSLWKTLNYICHTQPRCTWLELIPDSHERYTRTHYHYYYLNFSF